MARQSESAGKPNAAIKSSQNSPDLIETSRLNQDKRFIVLLACLTVFGLLIRLWGLGWGLPDDRHPLSTYHPDELVNLGAARAVDIPHGRFDTGFYNYGTLYFYTVSLAQTIGRGYHFIPESAAAPADDALISMQKNMPEQKALFYTGRLVTALLGSATIWVVGLLGLRLYGKRAGLISALLYGSAPLAVVHAHFLTVDVPAALPVTLCLLYGARLLVRPEDGDAAIGRRFWITCALAGLFGGLAAATKYTTVLVLAAPLTALLLPNTLQPAAKRLQGCGLMLLIAAAAFFIACPGPWLNPDVFWHGSYPGSGVLYELFEHSRSGHGELFLETGRFGWWYHLSVSLRYGLGEPLLLLSLAGIALAIRRRTSGDWILLAFTGIYFLLNGLSAVRFARYMIPIIPALALLAGSLTAGIGLEKFTPFARKLAGALGILVILLTGGLSLLYLRSMSGRDPRDQAADWITTKVPSSAVITFARIPWYSSPPLSQLFGALRSDVRLQAANSSHTWKLRSSFEEWDVSVLTPPPDVVAISDLESYHPVVRLKEPRAVAFMQRLSSDPAYMPRTFTSGFPELISKNLPEDLRYVTSTVTLWVRKDINNRIKSNPSGVGRDSIPKGSGLAGKPGEQK